MYKPTNINLRLMTENLKYALKHDAADLFDTLPFRRLAPGSPHSEMTDIWVRYKNILDNIVSGDFSSMKYEHESKWYNSVTRLPGVKQMCSDIMYHVGGTRLGGVLITKLPPGGKITPHVDEFWHADYYTQFWVPIQNAPGAVMKFEGATIEPREGEVWEFDNSNTHSVENNSDKDKIAMIVCIKVER